MKKILLLMLLMVLIVQQKSIAYDFSVVDSWYDYTQTVEIYVIDLKQRKLFGMYDPFEIKVTTIPSRFYIAVLGAVARGHRNEFGVEIVDGPIGADFVVIFRSPNSSHVLHVGPYWIVDGTRQILLSETENRDIYELLMERTETVEPNDLKNFKSLFDEVEAEQKNANIDINVEDELKSINQAIHAINERLPKGHNDLENLPYYNKSLENQKYYDDKKGSRNIISEPSKDSIDLQIQSASNTSSSSGKIHLPNAVVEPVGDKQGGMMYVVLLILSVLVASIFYWFKK